MPQTKKKKMMTARFLMILTKKRGILRKKILRKKILKMRKISMMKMMRMKMRRMMRKKWKSSLRKKLQ
jgi:hypothetical protein